MLFTTKAIASGGFSSTNWIWTNEDITLPGDRAFRRDFCPPQGKTPSTANIYIAAANEYTLYVNGQEIGSGNNFQAGDAFCVTLSTGCNSFAVEVFSSLDPDPGLLTTIEVVYTDGTTNILLSESETWRSFTSVPAGFQQPGFNDSAWPMAVVQASYGSAPWGAVTLPLPTVPTFTFADALWIWTDEAESGTAPVGSRAFRGDLTFPAPTSSVAITIGADDEYTLYVQGNLIGSGTNFQFGQLYIVNIQPPTSQISIAVNATNTGGAAGVIAAINAFKVEDGGCGAVMSASTDGTWVYSTSFPTDWQVPNFGDSKWPKAFVEGQYGVGPWGTIAVPVNALYSIN